MAAHDSISSDSTVVSITFVQMLSFKIAEGYHVPLQATFETAIPLHPWRTVLTIDVR